MNTKIIRSYEKSYTQEHHHIGMTAYVPHEADAKMGLDM